MGFGIRVSIIFFYCNLLLIIVSLGMLRDFPTKKEVHLAGIYMYVCANVRSVRIQLEISLWLMPYNINKLLYLEGICKKCHNLTM